MVLSQTTPSCAAIHQTKSLDEENDRAIKKKAPACLGGYVTFHSPEATYGGGFAPHQSASDHRMLNR
jgi:hypothetical protein